MVRSNKFSTEFRRNEIELKHYLELTALLSSFCHDNFMKFAQRLAFRRRDLQKLSFSCVDDCHVTIEPSDFASLRITKELKGDELTFVEVGARHYIVKTVTEHKVMFLFKTKFLAQRSRRQELETKNRRTMDQGWN